MPPSPALSVAVAGALHVGVERGLAADLAAARALGLAARPVCTALVAAGAGAVADVTEVPADTVAAAFDCFAITGYPAGLKVGALGGPKTVDALFRATEGMTGPLVLDAVVSGPSGEVLLTERGIAALLDRWGRADLVTISRRDAELVTGGEIRSLDDAQVAAQRAHKRGARRVLLRCGALPARFFDADDPSGDGRPGAFMADLYYDGDGFALFEAPRLGVPEGIGASSALTLAALRALLDGRPMEEALQAGKRFATDSIRFGLSNGGAFRLEFERARGA